MASAFECNRWIAHLIAHTAIADFTEVGSNLAPADRPVTKLDRSLGPQNGEWPLYGGLRP